VSFFTRSYPLPVGTPTTVEDDLPMPDAAPDVPDPDRPDRDVPEPDDAPRAWRRVLRRGVTWVLNTLALALVLFALLLPNRLTDLTPGTFVRIPIEALVGVALALVLPARARRVVAVLAGVVLGLLAIGDAFDMGFYEVLARPFDPVLDWSLLGDAVDFVNVSVGHTAAVGAEIGAVLLVVLLLALMTWAVLRLTALVARHGPRATGGLGVLTVAWVTCLVLGVQFVPGQPVAAHSAAVFGYDRVVQVQAGLADQQAFAKESAVDAFAKTPASQLLTALRGKNVIIAFVESYGRSAVQDPQFAPQVNAVLDSGTQQLAAAGFSARSAFLTSPTFGGGSWLAHSTLLSGLWINNQQRYRNLVSTDRLTLDGAFHAAGWRTVGVMPGVTRAWPEGKFYGFDKIYDSHGLGYTGPHFSWAPMPDQYTLAAFQRAEHATPNGPPVMMEIPLVSSHAPWAPIPKMISWEDVGDGSVYDSQPAAGASPSEVWKTTAGVRTAYRDSIVYSLNALISYVKTYGDKNTVLVFLGDHQPATIVTGEGASHDVPVTIVAHDPAVLDRISGWGWQSGLRPDPQAPVWRMDAFRDKFLTAFGPQGGH
jgi:hypothetical protein